MDAALVDTLAIDCLATLEPHVRGRSMGMVVRVMGVVCAVDFDWVVY